MVLIQYAYDGLNQLIREDNAVLGKIYTFTYDTAGNITEKKILNRTALGVGVLEQTIPYVYSSTGWKDRLTSYNGESITYDALGNPTTYRGHNLTWGKIKQLEAFDSNTFAYNAEGIRIRKNTTTYELDGTKILREVRPNGAVEYFYGTTGVAGFRYNNADYFYQKNIQGDITAIYTATGTKVAEYIYDAWGNCTVTLDTYGIGTLNPFRYRSYYYDTETGLYYLQTRYYDPQIGRFINADSQFDKNAGLLTGNLFAYCANNPVGCIDSTGRDGVSVRLDYTEDKNPLNDYIGIGGALGGGTSVVDKIIDVAEVITLWTLLEMLRQASKAKEKTKAKEAAASKEDTLKKHYYWAAELIGKQVVILYPLSFAEACERVANYGNVMCANQDAARAIIITNGYRNAVGPERGKGEGFYWHYHPTRNHTGHKYSTHIWFYGGVK